MDITGLNKAAVLAALYNVSNQRGLGFLGATGVQPMTIGEAEQIIKSHGLHFDYLKGRVMKINLTGDHVWTGTYNRDNGPNAAENAVEPLRGGE